MRDKGFDRSPTMCTDKWRNLLKEFKKARHLDNSATGSVTKMSYYKDIDEILKERTKSVCFSKSPTPPNSSKVDSFLQFSDKGMHFLMCFEFVILILLWLCLCGCFGYFVEGDCFCSIALLFVVLFAFP